MIYCDIVNLATGTAGVYGTAGTITLLAEARKVCAIVNIGCDQTYTTAEGGAALVRINADSLGLSNQVFVSGPYTTSGPATNSSGQGMVQDIIPVDWDCNGNEVITIDVATAAATTTVARLHTVALLYWDTPPPPDWRARFPRPVPARGGNAVNAQQLTTARTALTTIRVPSWANEIIGVKSMVLKEGAITAAEEDLGYFELETTIKGTSPQRYPTNAIGATLGTPVGTGLYFDQVPWIPTFIPVNKKTEVLTPYINLRTAVTAGNRVIFSVAWR